MGTRAKLQAKQSGGQGLWVQVAMTAITLAIIGAGVSWQVRQSADETTTTITDSTRQGNSIALATPIGGLADRYEEEQQTRSSHRTDTTDTLDGVLAESVTPVLKPSLSTEERCRSMLC